MDGDGRDERIVEQEAEDAALDDECPETLEQLKVRHQESGVMLERLYQLRDRVERRQLEPDDWAFLGDLIREEL